MVRRCLLVLLLTGAPAYGVDRETVLVGLVVPASREAAATALHMRHAADLAITDWGPRLNRQVELRVYDDLFDPRHAVSIAERLVDEGVWGVVGHYYSSSSVAASVVYHKAGISQITATATHPQFTARGLATAFRVCGRDDRQALRAADFVLTRLKPQRIAVVHDRTEYGRGLVETFRSELARRGFTRVVAEASVAQGDREFSEQVGRLKGARADAVYFGGVFREAAHLVRQLRQANVAAAFFAGDAVMDPEFVRLAGEEAAQGTRLTSTPDPSFSASVRPLLLRYETRHGPFDPAVLYTYDAVGALLHAIWLTTPPGGGVDHQRIARALHERAYPGAAGMLRWDRNGDVSPAPYALYATQRGGRVQGWFDQVFPTREQERASPAGGRR